MGVNLEQTTSFACEPLDAVLITLVISEHLITICWRADLPDSLDAQSSASPYTGAELNLGDRVLGEVEKDSFTTLPGKGGHSGSCLEKPYVSQLGEGSEEFYRNDSKRAWSARGHFSDWLAVR